MPLMISLDYSLVLEIISILIFLILMDRILFSELRTVIIRREQIKRQNILEKEDLKRKTELLRSKIKDSEEQFKEEARRKKQREIKEMQELIRIEQTRQAEERIRTQKDFEKELEQKRNSLSREIESESEKIATHIFQSLKPKSKDVPL